MTGGWIFPAPLRAPDFVSGVESLPGSMPRASWLPGLLPVPTHPERYFWILRALLSSVLRRAVLSGHFALHSIPSVHCQSFPPPGPASVSPQAQLAWPHCLTCTMVLRDTRCLLERVALSLVPPQERIPPRYCQAMPSVHWGPGTSKRPSL